MWWKIYFWIITILALTGLIEYGTYPRWTVRDFLDVASLPIAILGLYAFIYKKSIFTKRIWMWFFWISIFFLVLDLAYLYSGALPLPPYLVSTNMDSMKEWFIPTMIILLPAWYAFYQLAYGTPATSSTKTSKKKR